MEPGTNGPGAYHIQLVHELKGVECRTGLEDANLGFEGSISAIGWTYEYVGPKAMTREMTRSFFPAITSKPIARSITAKDKLQIG